MQSGFDILSRRFPPFGLSIIGFVSDFGFRISDFFRPSNFGLRTSDFVLLSLCILLSPFACLAQKSELRNPPPLSREEGEQEARTLLSDLLARKPDQNSTNTGVLRIEDASRHVREISIKFQIVSSPANWYSTYETLASTAAQPGLKLTVTHTDGSPNQYLLVDPYVPGASNPPPKTLTGNQTMIPFAGSDFWIADLGLEFLHWPQQRVVKKEMRKSLPCDVLESINPHPAPGAYSRVESWIAPENGAIVHADAYDTRGRLLKLFDPTELQKVNGERQLKEMEIRNRQTGSRTKIDFNLGSTQ